MHLPAPRMEACLNCESLQQNSSLLQILAPRILFSLLPFTWLLSLHFDSNSCTYPPMGTIFALKEANYLVLTSVLLVSFIPSCDSAPETPAEFRIPFTHHPSLQHHLKDKLELLFSNSREYEQLLCEMMLWCTHGSISEAHIAHRIFTGVQWFAEDLQTLLSMGKYRLEAFNAKFPSLHYCPLLPHRLTHPDPCPVASHG